MSRKTHLIIIFLVLTLGIPYIKIMMLYSGIIQLACANFIKNTCMAISHHFSIELPMIIWIVIAESFLPFVLTIAIERLFNWQKWSLKMHPATLATSLWLILNGSNLLIQ